MHTIHLSRVYNTHAIHLTLHSQSGARSIRRANYPRAYVSWQRLVALSLSASRAQKPHAVYATHRYFRHSRAAYYTPVTLTIYIYELRDFSLSILVAHVCDDDDDAVPGGCRRSRARSKRAELSH